MVKRLLQTGLAIAALLAILWAIAASHQAVIDGSRIMVTELDEDPFLYVPTIYFLVFIALLVLRYLLLIAMSFIEHLDKSSAAPADGEDNAQPALGSGGGFPLISIIVPAYNEELVIQAAVRSLIQLDYPNYEVIVVDDGSSDDTYHRALAVARESQQVPIRVLTKTNGGKADALNTGLAHARGEFVLNMDGDAKLSPNTLRACIQHFSEPSIGAVAGNIKVVNRENFLTRIQALEYIEGLALARKAQSLLHAVVIIPGPLGMFRKSALAEVGGYDHDTFAEDCDLTLKLLMQGWHVVYEPAAQAWVETPSRLLDLLKQRYRWTRGILQAIGKHKQALWQPHRTPTNFLILWYMLFESVLWPFSSVAGTVFFAGLGVVTGSASLLAFWWLQLTLLDLIAAYYCIVIERENRRLIPYALLFRVFFIVVIDVAKVFATFEEMFKLKMSWGKLQREGKL